MLSLYSGTFTHMMAVVNTKLMQAMKSEDNRTNPPNTMMNS